MLVLLPGAWAAGLDRLPSFVGSEPDAPPEVVQPAGDLDGDGLGDLVVGVPGDDAAGDTAGAIWIVYGPQFGLLDGTTPLADLGPHLVGEETQDRAGADVAALGDSDGDGFDDVAVGAPEATAGQSNAGKVYLIYGQASPYEDQSLGAEPAMHGVENSDRVGTRVYGPGDLDGDGLADLLLGVPYSNPAGDPGPGWVAILFGRSIRIPDDTRIDTDIDANSEGTTADQAIWINQPISLAGRSAAVVPDLDGDGLPELLVGAPGVDSGLDETGIEQNIGTIEPPGVAYLFYGHTREEMAADSVLTEGDAAGVIAGNYLTANLPWTLAALPDGRVAMGVPLANNQGGSVLLFDEFVGTFTEADAVARWDGVSSSDEAGWGLAPAHGLGGALVAIGEPGYDEGRGRVRLADEGGDLVTLEGCTRGDLAGAFVRSHPGPDPTGADAGWIGISSPGLGWYQEGNGFGYVITQDALAGLVDGPCLSGDVVPPTDADGDGYAEADDCDDAVAWRHPGAMEVCGDDVDDNCDGTPDESCGPLEGKVGCGCGSVPSPGAVGAALAAALGMLTIRRRR